MKEKEKAKQEKKFPNMSDPVVPQPKPVKFRTNRKKPLKTPSYLLRISLIFSFLAAVYLLCFPYISATFYITENLEITTNPKEAYLEYATQEQINSAAKELQTALNHMEKTKAAKEAEESDSKEESSQVSQNTSPVASSQYRWLYHVQEGIEYQSLTELVEQARSLNKNLYTEQSNEALSKATLNAQKALVATVTVSKSPFELMFGGNTLNTELQYPGVNISSTVLLYALAILPFIGFFTALFDRKFQIKFISAMLCSVFSVMIIFMAIYPFIAIGAVLSVFVYILCFTLGIFGIYALQQENYIIQNPHLEAEFTEKHPHFVKALINYKSFSKSPEIKEESSENQNIKKTKKRQSKKR